MIRRRTPQAIYPDAVRVTPIASLFDLAPDGVYLATNCYQLCGALLPHPFTLTCLIETSQAVFSLLHLPSARAAQMLSGVLPNGARTFLGFNPKTENAIARSTHGRSVTKEFTNDYYNYIKRQKRGM